MDEVGDVQENILRVFREFNVGAGEYLPAQGLISNTAGWTPPERQLVPRALEKLVEEGHVELTRTRHGYRLTESGESLAYAKE